MTKNVPEEWKSVAIGELVKVLGGFAFKSADFADSGAPVIRISNFNVTSIDLSNCARIPIEKIGKGSRFKIKPGDTLIAMSGATTGKLGFVPDSLPEDCYLNQRVGVFRIPTDSPLHLSYFRRLLGTKFYQTHVKKLAGGAAQPNISGKQLESAIIPLPPLSEQKRIAKILDTTDALRAKRRESLTQLDILLKSTFMDMFGDPVANSMGWKTGRLADIVERLDGGKNIAQSETETDYRVLKVSAVTYGVYRPDESKYLPADFNVPESYIVKNGDLLISRANTVELIGATAYVWETPKNIALPDKIWKFIWKKGAKIEPLFIYHLSQNVAFRRILASRASGTSGSMKNIAKPKLLSLPIPLPPLTLQTHFAAIVKSIEQQKARQRAHLAELDTLFAALQQRAFNGEL